MILGLIILGIVVLGWVTWELREALALPLVLALTLAIGGAVLLVAVSVIHYLWRIT